MNNLRSKIIIGVWSLSGDYGKVNSNHVNKIIGECIKKKFFEFDTAPTYGRGKIDKLLSKFKKNNKKIKINTKCGYNSLFKKTFKIKDIKESIDKSLKLYGNLNTVYLHNPRKEIKNWHKTINLLNELKKQKKIKYTGISLAHDFNYDEKIVNKFDCIQNEFNLLRPQTKINLSKIKKTIYARSPFASGILNSEFNLNKNFLIGDQRKNWLVKDRLVNIYNQKKEIEKICDDKIENYALKFVLNSSLYKKVIVGIKKKSHVDFIYKIHLNKKLKITKKFLSNLDNLHNKNFFLIKNSKLY